MLLCSGEGGSVLVQLRSKEGHFKSACLAVASKEEVGRSPPPDAETEKVRMR